MRLAQLITNPALSPTVGTGDGLTILESALIALIGVATVIAGLFFVFQIFSGSFQWLTSGGDKQALENARKVLTHAIVGLLMIVLSFALISLISIIFGFNNLLDPTAVLNGLRL